MATWIGCGENFITGDVIRWVEPVWKAKARKNEKTKRIGARMVTAQVMSCGPEWAVLDVIACKTEGVDPWYMVKELEGEIRRRRAPIGQGDAHRKPWSDEGARSITASRFFKALDADAAFALPRNSPGSVRWRGNAGATARRGGAFSGRRKKGTKTAPLGR